MSENKENLENLEVKENKPVPGNVDQYIVEPPEEPDAGPDPEELKAKESGWAPKEDWRGNPDDWVDAAEFNRRGPIMKTLNAQLGQELSKANEKIARMEKAMKAFEESNERIIQKDTDEVLADLRTQRADAISMGDGEAVNRLDDEIDAFKSKMKVAPKEDDEEEEFENDTPTQYPPEFVDFTKDNEWYATAERVNNGAQVDWEMTQITDALAASFYQQKQAAGEPQPTPTEALNYVSHRIKAMYPDKFSEGKSSNKQTPPNFVEPQGGARARQRENTSTSKVTINDYPREQQNMIYRLAEGSGMEVQAYVDKMQENG